MKAKIKKWYKLGLWSESMVRKAVKRGVITSEDFEEITGQKYGEV